MKKILTAFIILLIGINILQSCKKEENIEDFTLQNYVKTQKDQDYSDLAFIISKAIDENKEFKALVRKEALKKMDGDYNILFKNIVTQTLTNYNNKKQKKTVGNLINSYADKLIFKEKNNKLNEFSNYISYLQKKYPELQISVPIHAEEWDEDFVPKVTFISDNLKDGISTEIPAYQNNEIYKLNNMVVPDEPVIVIGDSERTIISPDGQSDVMENFSLFNVYNFVLTGYVTQNGIKLEWNYDNTDNNIILGYKVYRKVYNSNSFQLLSTIYGVNNKIYDDVNVNSNESYSYYIKCFNISQESNVSNIINIQAPQRPNSLAGFDVILHNLTNLEARWALPQNQSIDFVRLEKMIPGIDNDYVFVNDFSQNTLSYINHNLTPGHKIIYCANIHTANSSSNYIYDFVKVPYRDPSIPTPVYLEKISFDWNHINDIEGWLRGAPEFLITVIVTNEVGEKSIIHEGINVDFCRRHSWNNFNDINLNEWLPGSFLDILAIKVEERDGGPKVDLKFSAKYEHKDSTKTKTFSASVDVIIPDILDSKNDNIGIGYLRYTDPVSKTVSIPGSLNFKMKLSTIDNIQTCYL